MKYIKKDFCRCCKQNDLYLYLNLGMQPLANSYHKGEKLPTIPLEVMLCRNCFHNQLSVVVNPDEMFRNYLYVSGTSETFRNHTKELAKDAADRINKKNIQVLDIACNDGTQLEFFRLLGCEVLGVDPAENLEEITKKKQIPVIVDYWTQTLALRLQRKFDIITATNVFAHVDDVDEFLAASKIALSDDGFLILEFPYAENMITNNEFDTVYHEHLSYFLVNSFKVLVDRFGLSIKDIIRTPIHGGSIRFFLQKGKNRHNEKVNKLIKEEKTKGLLNEKAYITFAGNVRLNKKNMQNLLKELTSKKKKVIGYAASAKGNTMLNYFKIKLDYIVDDNPLKWGYMTPGRNIPIYDTSVIEKEKGEIYIVILAWNFYNEIVKRIAKVRSNKNDCAILYVPTVRMQKIDQRNTYDQSA